MQEQIIRGSNLLLLVSPIKGRHTGFSILSLRRFLFPGRPILSIPLPIYPSSFIRTCPSHPSLASRVFSPQLGAKTIKKNTNSTQNKSQTHRAKQYEVTSFLSTDCELSTETCSKNVYSLGPRSDISITPENKRRMVIRC